MLSRRDIEKELGKGINIFPLYRENVKENSVNLTVSTNAWTLGKGTVHWSGGADFSIEETSTKKKTFTLTRGNSCVRSIPGSRTGREKKYVILLPHTTTIVESEEVIGVANNIGGALHSKVGIVCKGIGHLGTMLGPGYCGHLMVSLHNITEEVIVLKVGTSFASLTFDYLNTQVVRTSATISGHVDKFSELGIQIDEDTRRYLTKDWKANIEGIRNKMIQTQEYKDYKAYIQKNMWKEIRKYINKRNILATVVVITIFIGLLLTATWVDKRNGTTVWVERFWNVGCSGLVGSLLINLFAFLKDKK